jgi:hypothetical protein
MIILIFKSWTWQKFMLRLMASLVGQAVIIKPWGVWWGSTITQKRMERAVKKGDPQSSGYAHKGRMFFKKKKKTTSQWARRSGNGGARKPVVAFLGRQARVRPQGGSTGDGGFNLVRENLGQARTGGRRSVLDAVTAFARVGACYVTRTPRPMPPCGRRRRW